MSFCPAAFKTSQSVLEQVRLAIQHRLLRLAKQTVFDLSPAERSGDYAVSIDQHFTGCVAQGRVHSAYDGAQDSQIYWPEP